MTALPGGTLTFLLTDIEGSTRHWEHEPEAMSRSMIRHDAVFDETVERLGGFVVRPRGEGDSRFAVFPRASNAVEAACRCQQQWFDEQWPTETPLRVRAALHTGEAGLRDGDYYGSAVNRCARIRSLAHGGQTLLSRVTAQLVQDNLPAGVTLRDLGEHALKDLVRPEQIYQLVVPGLPADFPPLVSTIQRQTNLPTQITSFIGREREIDATRERLLDPAVRVVTLVGPGGTGKTRLSLRVAELLADEFDDGVFFVSLSPIHDPELVIPTIAQVFGVRTAGDRIPLDAIRDYLQDKTLLLVLDNFDHLIEAAPEIATLLSNSPTLKILVTSRESLRIRGNRDISVPPLGVPDPTKLPPVDHLARYESVRLFVERAREVDADFELTPENAAAIAGICHRLDGLPLAIELAAARVRLFSPSALLTRLDRRLPLLTGGAHDLPTRHRTLRGTIAWSYDLLSPADQILFRQLSVFSGGFTIDSAEAVARGTSHDPANEVTELDILSGIDSLTSKSLIRRLMAATNSDQSRFGMLETIREYGNEQLELHDESREVRERHARAFLALAEEAEPELTGPDQARWLEQLESDHDNMRAALEWANEHPDADLALRISGALWPFWDIRGYVTEGRRWLEQALGSDGSPRYRANALIGAGTMAWSQGDYQQAAEYHDRALKLFRELDDSAGVAFALKSLGAQAVALEDYPRATALYQESLQLFRELGDEYGISDIVNNLGVVAQYQGDLAGAGDLYQESLLMRRRLGDTQRVADALYNLAEVSYYQGIFGRAKELYQDSLALRSGLGAPKGAAFGLAALASIAVEEGDFHRAALLYGAARGLFEATGISLDSTEGARFGHTEDSIRAELGQTATDELIAEGQMMSVDEAIEYVFGTA